MNEYNYDYLGINGIIPNSAVNFMNNIPNNMLNPNINYNQNMKIEPNINNNIIDPTKGFIRGNMFNNLYNQYKNYKPNNLNPQNEREAMLMNYQQYNFALNDLNLYLDNYPNDTGAINLYKEYLNIIKKIQEEYEKEYGPLKCNSMYIGNNTWKWNNNPWPWEVVK